MWRTYEQKRGASERKRSVLCGTNTKYAVIEYEVVEQDQSTEMLQIRSGDVWVGPNDIDDDTKPPPLEGEVEEPEQVSEEYKPTSMGDCTDVGYRLQWAQEEGLAMPHLCPGKEDVRRGRPENLLTETGARSTSDAGACWTALWADEGSNGLWDDKGGREDGGFKVRGWSAYASWQHHRADEYLVEASAEYCKRMGQFERKRRSL